MTPEHEELVALRIKVDMWANTTKNWSQKLQNNPYWQVSTSI